MRILLVNKFYYPRGGDCIYMLNLERLLKNHEHEVAVFAMQYSKNLPSEWSRYWPSQMTILKAFTRPFGVKEVKEKFSELLDDFQPDIVHLNNIHTQLSPIIAEIAHSRGKRVVWTLHDYKLLCPRYDCLQNGKTICEDCFYDKHKVLEHSCMKNSKIASVIAYYEAKKWHRQRMETATDLFICPSQFMADKMMQGGFEKNKLKPLCNFIDVEKCKRDSYEKDDYYCFIGRLSHEKGVKTLVEVANKLPYKLVIIGSGPLEKELKALAKSNIEFVGFKQWDEIKPLLGRAKFSITPSEWYEVLGLVNLEAMCLGTPVLAARIGGIPEIIEEGITGMTFESRNQNDLNNKIQTMWRTKWDYSSIAYRAQERYSSETYYKQLIEYYKRKGK